MRYMPLIQNNFTFLLKILALMLILVPASCVGSTDPTVIITGYKISPDVILPHDMGTIETSPHLLQRHSTFFPMTWGL